MGAAGVGVAAALVISLTFVVGVLVGVSGRDSRRRHRLRWREEASRAEPARSRAAAGARALERSGGAPERERPEKERLTFYHTLTAPVAAAGGAPAGADRKPAGPSGRPRAPEPGRAPAATAPRSLATTAAGAPTPAPVAGTSPGDDGRSGGRWAVQVGRLQEPRSGRERPAPPVRLWLHGLVSSVAASDGLRYRVRLGGYGSRGEAEQVAARVRSGGGLSTFVTPL